MDTAVFFIVWLLLALGVGALASSRGRNAFGFFLLSAVMSPLLGLIVVLVMSDLNKEAEKELERRREHERQLEAVRAIAATAKGSVTDVGSAKPADSNGKRQPPLVADELQKLVALRDSGVLTDAEFDRQKSVLLARSALS